MANEPVDATEAVAAIAECANSLAPLAAPRLLARWLAATPHEQIRGVFSTTLGRFLKFTGALRARRSPGSMDRFLEAEATLQELLRMLETWQPGDESNRLISEQARRCLVTMGFDAPPGGWETFEGWTEDEPQR